MGAVEEEGKMGDHTHTTRYTELHAQYLQLVETLLSGFLEEEGRTSEELFSDMKDAKENNYTALFEEHEYHGFVQSVLDAMEYKSFYELMLKAAATTAQDGDAGGGSDRRSPRPRRVNARSQNRRLTGGTASGSESDGGSVGTERDNGEDDRGLRRTRK
eukprot:g6622.t1